MPSISHCVSRLRFLRVFALALAFLVLLTAQYRTAAAANTFGVPAFRQLTYTDTQYRTALKDLNFAKLSAQADQTILAGNTVLAKAFRAGLKSLGIQRPSQLNRDYLYTLNKKTGVVRAALMPPALRAGGIRPDSGLANPVYWNVYDEGFFGPFFRVESQTIANCTIDWLGDWCLTANGGLLSNGTIGFPFVYSSGVEWARATATGYPEVLSAGSKIYKYFGGAEWESTAVLVFGAWTIEFQY